MVPTDLPRDIIMKVIKNKIEIPLTKYILYFNKQTIVKKKKKKIQYFF